MVKASKKTAADSAPTPRQTLTVSDIAERFNVAPEKVLKWIKARELPAVNIAVKSSGRPRWRIKPEDLASFEAARSNVRPSSSQPPARRAQHKRDRDVIPFF